MSDLFPLSVVFHFPPEVYLSRGVGDLSPLLVRAWHVKKDLRCKQPGHVARECGQAGGQPRPSSSVPVPVPVPVPDGPVSSPDPVPVLDPDPVPATGLEDDGDMSSVSSDHLDPPVPDPVPVLPYPSLTVEDIPRRPRAKHTKRLVQPTTAFLFSSPKVPVIPKSKAVSFRK